MDTILIQLNHHKALQLILDLEDLDLIKVLKKSMAPNQKLSDKYAGKLSKESGEQLQQYINKTRNEWNRDI